MDSRARIIRKERWGDYFLLSLESPDIASAAEPGQFVMIRTSAQLLPFLRRPFSIHDADGANIEIFFEKVGLGTSLLSGKEVDDTLDIIGPLGKGYSLRMVARGRPAALVGGGRGIAPLYFLARRLLALKIPVSVFYGGRTESDLPLKEKFDHVGVRLFLSTDDGSFGFHGLITDCLEHQMEKKGFDRMFACGPDVMLERIARISQERKIPAEVSLESLMGCGFGACWGCVRMIKTGGEPEWQKICEQGPVFAAGEVIWEEGF